MLVDLGRNDVGRVARYGTVKVRDYFTIERYSHVLHLVSQVEGELRPELNAIDVLRACFPAGTVSGAPKVRAMQIIDELEPVRRGPYAGAVGYLAYGAETHGHGNRNSNDPDCGWTGAHSGRGGNCRRLGAEQRVRGDTRESARAAACYCAPALISERSSLTETEAEVG